MTIESFKQALKAIKRDERHHTVAETEYWLNQYRMLAEQAVAALEEAEKQEPVAWDVFELRLYGAPLEKQHRVLWVDRYTHQDGSTPDLDGLLEAAKKDGGIDGGAKTLYVRPLYTTPPAAPGYIKGDTRSELVDNDFEEQK